jgi:hypothetical protein
MKSLRYLLGFLTFAAGLTGHAMADEPHPKPITLPDGAKALTPAGMNPIFFASEGSDVVMIVEAPASPSPSPASDPYANPQTRWLLFFRKEQGSYKEIDRSNKIIACSTCGNGGMDPFAPQAIKLSDGVLTVEQDYSPEPSTAVYKFSYNVKQNHWMVLSAIHTDVQQNPLTSAFNKSSHKLPLPVPPLAANFDPGWTPREPGVAVTVNEKTNDFSFLHADTNNELDDKVKADCADQPDCHELGRQVNGCIALFKDNKGKFYIGKSAKLSGPNNDDLRDKEAQNQAQKSCESNGTGSCQLVRSDCT